MDLQHFEFQNIPEISFGDIKLMDYSAVKVDSFSVQFTLKDTDHSAVIKLAGSEAKTASYDCSGKWWKGDSRNYPECAAWRGKNNFAGCPAGSVILPLDEITGGLIYDPVSDSFGTLLLNGTEHRIVGISTEADCIFAEFSGIDDQIVPKFVKYHTSEPLSKNEENELADILYSVYHNKPDAQYSRVDEAESRYSKDRTLFLLLYLISLSAFAMIITFLTRKSIRMYSVFYACGASKGLICCSIFLQNICLTVSAWIVAILTVSAVRMIKMSTLFALKDLLSMFVIVIICSAVVSIPGAAAIFSMSPNEAKKVR